MNILIKGMEMPRGKPICIIIDPAGQVRRYDLNNDKYADDELFEAIHVPPHGILIDADALHEELYALEYARENEWLDGVREARGVDAARVALLDAPTIIPAEEAET